MGRLGQKPSLSSILGEAGSEPSRAGHTKEKKARLRDIVSLTPKAGLAFGLSNYITQTVLFQL